MSRKRFALVGGGARSGKSAFALQLALTRGNTRIFLATAQAFDDEMRARIDAHIAERGSQFTTIETPYELDRAVASLGATRPDVDVVVIDCLTLWLSNLLLAAKPPAAILDRVDALAHALAEAPFDSVIITNEVGMGLVPETPLGRVFRDLSGHAHQRLARTADEVYLAALGVILRLRPGPVALVDEGATP